MYVNELLAIAKQNELRQHAEQARLVRQARGGRAGIVSRGLTVVREKITNLVAPAAEPAVRVQGDGTMAGGMSLGETASSRQKAA
jgi:hypothetical protein